MTDVEKISTDVEQSLLDSVSSKPNKQDICIEARGMFKQYPGTLALNDVDFVAYKGKVNVLIGENGAGKSTLMRIIAGIELPSRGKIIFNGEEVTLRSTLEARRLGIHIIHQELSYFPQMSIVDNMFAGREIRSMGVLLDRKKQLAKARETLQKLNLDINPNEKMVNLRVGQQQIVEISKALIDSDLHVLIMDEPTSALSKSEVEALFKLVKELKQSGVTIIYISHRLEEILRIGDHITVLRDGKKVAQEDAYYVDMNWMITNMIGRKKSTIKKVPYKGVKKELLRAERVCLSKEGGGYIVENVELTLSAGEVLGMYGLLGSGRTEFVECLMGVHPRANGKIWFEGQQISPKSISSQIKLGMTLIPEDRQAQSLIPELSIRNNLVLSSIERFRRGIIIDDKLINHRTKEMVKRLKIKIGGLNHQIITLSGGNQQKVVIGKGLMVSPKILIMDEPSRGIDIGAKTEIFILMRELAAEGLGIIFVGSELQEIVDVCDRVLVMKMGAVAGEFQGDEINEINLANCAASGFNIQSNCFC